MAIFLNLQKKRSSGKKRELSFRGNRKRRDDNMVQRHHSAEKTIQERMAEEELIQERTDAKGNRWRKVYFGGGEHFKNWLSQCNELGEVMVEEVDSKGYKCFEQAGEKLYRIWTKMDARKEGDIF